MALSSPISYILMEVKMKKIYNYAKIIFLSLITISGAIGIIIAPSRINDSEVLQKELENNKEFLTGKLSETSGDYKDVSDIQVTIIGDSVVLGASRALSEIIPECFVDAEESRQARNAINILEKLETQGKLGDTVIIALGINGYFYEETGQEIIDYIGSERTIYWINIYGKYLQSYDATNKVISNLVSQNDNVHLIDWASEAPNHPDWFYSDGIHLNKEGQEGFSKFVYDNIQ